MNKEEIENYIAELESMFELSELEEHSRNILKVGNYIKQLQQENKRLKDNHNQLKKHIQECLDEVLQNDVYDRTSYEQGVIAGLESSLFKLEELEHDIAQ